MILNNDSLFTLNNYDIAVITGKYEQAFPEEFSNVQNEFDRRDLMKTLQPKIDKHIERLLSIKLVRQLSAAPYEKDAKMWMSEYDFDKKQFNIHFSQLNKYSNYFNPISSREYLISYGKLRMFFIDPQTLDKSVITSMTDKYNNTFSFAIPMEDESKARELAQWRSTKPDFYDKTQKHGVYGVGYLSPLLNMGKNPYAQIYKCFESLMLLVNLFF